MEIHLLPKPIEDDENGRKSNMGKFYDEVNESPYRESSTETHVLKVLAEDLYNKGKHGDQN